MIRQPPTRDRADGTRRPDAPAPRGPRLLLVATMPWMFPARLALAFRRIGFHVDAVCRTGHPLRLLAEPIRTHQLGWLREGASIQAAIRRANPDLIIPCDDPAVLILHHLHRRDPRLSALIERSLGNPAAFGVAENRSQLVALARSLGLRVPNSKVTPNRRALTELSAQVGYPCVLKRDQTWGGIGVTVVQNAQQLEGAWSWIAGGLSTLRAGKAVWRDGRPRTLLDMLIARSTRVEVQQFVPGTPANRAVLCRDGKVIAGISVLALQTASPGGPASVVQIVDHPEMTHVVETLVRELGLSGFCGFDFMVSSRGHAYLLELNPRATPVAHLAIPDGTHLPTALYRDLTGLPPAAAVAPVPGDLVAIFPTEWQRDPLSTSSPNVHHDAPWDEPGLLARAGLVTGASVSGPSLACARREMLRPQVGAPGVPSSASNPAPIAGLAAADLRLTDEHRIR